MKLAEQAKKILQEGILTIDDYPELKNLRDNEKYFITQFLKFINSPDPPSRMDIEYYLHKEGYTNKNSDFYIKATILLRKLLKPAGIRISTSTMSHTF